MFYGSYGNLHSHEFHDSLDNVSNKFNSGTTRQTIRKQAKEEHILVLVAAKIHDVPLTKELNAQVRFEGKVNSVINRISISIDQD